MGIFAFDELVHACLRVFGKKEKNSIDQFGQETFSYGMFKSYGKWSNYMFLATFLCAIISLVFASFAYLYT